MTMVILDAAANDGKAPSPRIVMLTLVLPCVSELPENLPTRSWGTLGTADSELASAATDVSLVAVRTRLPTPSA